MDVRDNGPEDKDDSDTEVANKKSSVACIPGNTALVTYAQEEVYYVSPLSHHNTTITSNTIKNYPPP